MEQIHLAECAGCCEDGNELSSAVICGVYLDWLGNCQLLRQLLSVSHLVTSLLLAVNKTFPSSLPSTEGSCHYTALTCCLQGHYCIKFH